MRSTEALFAQLEEPDRLDAIRREIYSLLRQALKIRHMTLDKWQTFHFANAIRSLALNVDAVAQPSHDWLRLCLTDFRMALFPPSVRRHAIEETVLQSAEQLPAYDQMMAALDQIAHKLKIMGGRSPVSFSHTAMAPVSAPSSDQGR